MTGIVIWFYTHPEALIALFVLSIASRIHLIRHFR